MRSCALLDSGSAFTIINVKNYSKLNLPLSPFEVACFSATAEPVSILGAVTCKVKVDRYSWKHKFLVSDNVSSDIILGADFISKTKLLIDLSKREIFSHLSLTIDCVFMTHLSQKRFIRFSQMEEQLVWVLKIVLICLI